MGTTRLGLKLLTLLGVLTGASILLLSGFLIVYSDLPFTMLFALSVSLFLFDMLFVYYAIERSISQPVYELVRLIRSAQAGKFDEEIRISDDTELKTVGAEFLDVMKKLQEAKDLLGRRKVLELSTIYKIATAMSSIFDLNALLKLIVDLATQVLEARNASLMLIDEETQTLSIKVANGLPEDIIRNTRIKIGEGIAGTVAAEGKPYYSQNIEKDPRFKRQSDSRYKTKSFISVPIVLKDRVIGVLNVNDKITGTAFTEDDLDLLNVLAYQSAISIENSRLYQKAERKVEELETLLQASRAMSSVLDIGVLLKQILEICNKIVHAKAGLVLFKEAPGDSFDLRTFHGDLDGRLLSGFRIEKNSQLYRRLEIEKQLTVIAENPHEVKEEVFSSRTSGNGNGNGVFSVDKARDELAALIRAVNFEPGSIIVLPLVRKEDTIGALILVNSKGEQLYSENDMNILRALSSQAAIVIENAKLYESVKEHFITTIRVATTALEFKDAYTSGHSERVTDYSVAIAKEMGLPPERVEYIRQGAVLHDIGKIGISEAILLKKGKLTNEEFAAIKLHPVIGDNIVEPMNLPAPVRFCIRNHHERWDGRGYPDGLAGEDIPLEARIICVADSFDAMTSNRPYRDALAMEKVLEELKRCSGSQFDTKCVEALLSVLQKQGNIIDGVFTAESEIFRRRRNHDETHKIKNEPASN